MSEKIDRSQYTRVRSAKDDEEKAPKAANVIRVVHGRLQRPYISYAINVLTGDEGVEKHDSIEIQGMGPAVFNAVNIAEIVKHRVAGLHQITAIGSTTMVDEYKSKKDETDVKSVERKLSTITITLSMAPLDTTNVGYQAPLPESEVVAQDKAKTQRRREPKEPKAEGEKKERKPRAPKKDKADKPEKADKAEGEKGEKKERKPREPKKKDGEKKEGEPKERKPRAPREPREKKSADKEEPKEESRGRGRGARGRGGRGGRGRGAAERSEGRSEGRPSEGRPSEGRGRGGRGRGGRAGYRGRGAE